MDERWGDGRGEYGDDGECGDVGDGTRPEALPGSGIVVAFGKLLKLLREKEGLDRAELGRRTGYSASTIGSFEQGRRIPPGTFIDRADEVLGAGGALKVFKEGVAEAQYPPFFREVPKLEAEAVELHVYANQAVPGLLQTKEYSRAVFGIVRPPLDEEAIEQRVVARMERQKVFERRSAPLTSFVVDESVLRRPMGGRDVLRGQLEQILLMGQLRTVEIQVMPLDREENAGMAGPFSLIETKQGRRIAYVEVQNVSRVHTDRASVRRLEAKYGILRAQALTPRESSAFIEKLLGEL
ncbi:helix-turn-helix transcriptional regulator [Streptomyces sp. NPDC048560]|uniref:helix-turn-helix domain-containing protein n=1 Tax=Streptomyces sp. NPDC048560 TaxID=3155488 RepID=UPI00342593FD